MACASRGIDFQEETEKGDGYPDVVLTKLSAYTVVILEFNKGDKELKKLKESADTAIEQIITKNYASSYIDEGYTHVYGIGIGFGGKDCVVKSLGNLAKNKLYDNN